MGDVMPFRRSASVDQCRKVTETEELMVAQIRLWFAWVRVVNRIWWGA